MSSFTPFDPDEALVQKAGQGDARAAEALVRRHLGRMISLARRMLGDAAEAEDVGQEVLLRAWKEAPRWTPGAARFETWLHRVALNLCYDRLRRRREALDPEAGLHLADPDPGPAEAWASRQRVDAVQKALAALPDRQKAAIVLVSFQEMPQAQAAAALEISVDALESLLARARRALKAALAGRADDLLGAVEPGE